ncbi:hypothetical protein Sango_0460500 [Sesamum angolense]|uniref:Uncharacterized protein n=1 Tax=Sesamum angolense TaxID=2727404 RepID=A0AAE1XBH4_9LAMI|nr:hypothetical protein Sango_0460500 [Sesamum angolense]
MENEDCYQKVTEPKYECLLFDVDDTIYPLSSGISAECTKNIIEYMMTKLGIEEREVPEMCAQLYKEYGTTMAGLRAIGYDFDYDDYHSFVHGRLPYEWLKPDHTLRSLLHSLPIRKVLFFDDSIRNLQSAKGMGVQTVWVGSSHRTEGVDYALESIHNMREALPELWDAEERSDVGYSEKPAIETYVRA